MGGSTCTCNLQASLCSLRVARPAASSPSRQAQSPGPTPRISQSTTSTRSALAPSQSTWTPGTHCFEYLCSPLFHIPPSQAVLTVVHRDALGDLYFYLDQFLLPLECANTSSTLRAH